MSGTQTTLAARTALVAARTVALTSNIIDASLKKFEQSTKVAVARQVVHKAYLGRMIGKIVPPCTLFIGIMGQKVREPHTIDMLSIYQRREDFHRRSKNSRLRKAAGIEVINLNALGPQGWEPADASGQRRSIATLLESKLHTLVVWRADVVAGELWKQFGVHLRGHVLDVQLMAAARAKPTDKPELSTSLQAAAEETGLWNDVEMSRSKEIRKTAQDLYSKMADPDVPSPMTDTALARQMISAAGEEVRYMTILYQRYFADTSVDQLEWVMQETQNRINGAIEAAGRPLRNAKLAVKATKLSQQEKQLNRQKERKKKGKK